MAPRGRGPLLAAALLLMGTAPGATRAAESRFAGPEADVARITYVAQNVSDFPDIACSGQRCVGVFMLGHAPGTGDPMTVARRMDPTGMTTIDRHAETGR